MYANVEIAEEQKRLVKQEKFRESVANHREEFKILFDELKTQFNKPITNTSVAYVLHLSKSLDNLILKTITETPKISIEKTKEGAFELKTKPPLKREEICQDEKNEVLAILPEIKLNDITFGNRETAQLWRAIENQLLTTGSETQMDFGSCLRSALTIVTDAHAETIVALNDYNKAKMVYETGDYLDPASNYNKPESKSGRERERILYNKRCDTLLQMPEMYKQKVTDYSKSLSISKVVEDLLELKMQIQLSLFILKKTQEPLKAALESYNRWANLKGNSGSDNIHKMQLDSVEIAINDLDEILKDVDDTIQNVCENKYEAKAANSELQKQGKKTEDTLRTFASTKPDLKQWVKNVINKIQEILAGEYFFASSKKNAPDDEPHEPRSRSCSI